MVSASRASNAAVAAHERTGPPFVFLAVAALCVATGGALLATGDEMATHVAGYVIASVLTIVLIGLFRRFDLSRRLTPGYRPRPGARQTITALLIASFAVAGVHVWAIATELAS